MSEDELASLVGHRFPGGTYRVAHWENWLLTDCTGREPLPDGIVHPIVLFHAPILGAGTSIAELFRLGRASGESGSVGLVGYDWTYVEPLREDVEYRVDGGIVTAERCAGASGEVTDHVAFRIELARDGAPSAAVTNRWVFRRGSGHRPPSPSPSPSPPAVDTDLGPAGQPIPPWDMPSVDPARMKTMAAVLRDPYPVHWDRAANERLGIGGRVVNQGPLNLGYLANMLMDWAGPASVRRLAVSFGSPVLDGDHVVARGNVRDRRDGIAHCDIWLDRDGERVVSGIAEVVDPST